MNRRWYFLIAIVLILVLSGCQVSKMIIAPEAENDSSVIATGEVGPFRGQTAPDFTLKDLEGNSWTLSELKGQSVVLIFWASWCPPCKEEIPLLKEVEAAIKENHSKLLAISVDESVDDARKIVKEQSIPYTVLAEDTLAVAKAYGIRGIPNSVVINGDGIVVDNQVGAYESAQELIDLLEESQ